MVRHGSLNTRSKTVGRSSTYDRSDHRPAHEKIQLHRRGWWQRPRDPQTLGGVLSQSDLVAHAFELLDKPSLVGILLLALDEVVTAEFSVRLASFE